MPESSNKIISKIDPTSARYEKNMRGMAELVAAVRNEEEQIRQGGGEKGIESQHAKKRLTARERINLLTDKNTGFFEFGLYAAYEMYEEWGGAPAAGAVTGLGHIHGRMFMLIVNDATVKAGAFFPMTAKKSFAPRILPLRTTYPPSTWWILPAFFFRFRKMSSRIPTILAAF